MSQESSRIRIRMMMAVHERRERRAKAALHHGLAEHAAAAEVASQLKRAVSLHGIARRARAREIYQQMLKRPLSAQEMTGFDARLRQLDRDAARLAEQHVASVRASEAAQNQVQALRQHVVGSFRARRKWEELARRADGSCEARQSLIEELAASDGRIARPRS